MNKKDVTKTNERKSIRINLRTTKTISKWMGKNNISPQLIFDKSIEELMKE